MTHIASAPHELKANLNYTEYGLSPYWTVTNLLICEYDGYASDLRFEVDGEIWTVEFAYQSGGIAPRPQDDVGGETLYEPKINVRGDGERKVDFHIRPRYTGMEKPDGSRISSPFDRDSLPDEGYNVRVQASNLEPHEYTELLPAVVKRLGAEVGQRINPDYFTSGNLHASSNVDEYERYVRLRRSVNQKVIGTSGILQKLHFLLLDQQGVKYSIDVDNEDVVGKMHKMPLDRSAIREVPLGSRGKQLKSYLLKNPDSVDDTDPTYHPKFGVLFKRSLNSGNTIRWSKVEELTRELHESIINLLYWSGVPTDPDHTTFVPDDHFEARAYDEDANPTVRLFDDPTPNLEASQEAMLVRQLRELTDADMDHLRAMTDGGQRHYDAVIEEADTSVSTLYRTLKRCDALLESDNGVVKWRSKKIRQEVAAVFEHVEETVEAAADQAARLLGMDPQQLKEKGSAFQAWLNRYGAEILDEGTEPGSRVHIKITSVLSRFRSGSGEYIPKVLEYLEVVWSKAGFDASLHGAVIEYNTGNGYERFRYGSKKHQSLIESSATR
jgi:hypothetical protein